MFVDLTTATKMFDDCEESAREAVWTQLLSLIGAKHIPCSKKFSPVLQSWVSSPTINLLAIELLFLAFALTIEKHPELAKRLNSGNNAASNRNTPGSISHGRTHSQSHDHNRKQRESTPSSSSIPSSPVPFHQGQNTAPSGPQQQGKARRAPEDRINAPALVNRSEYAQQFFSHPSQTARPSLAASGYPAPYPPSAADDTSAAEYESLMGQNGKARSRSNLMSSPPDPIYYQYPSQTAHKGHQMYPIQPESIPMDPPQAPFFMGGQNAATSAGAPAKQAISRKREQKLFLCLKKLQEHEAFFEMLSITSKKHFLSLMPEFVAKSVETKPYRQTFQAWSKNIREYKVCSFKNENLRSFRFLTTAFPFRITFLRSIKASRDLEKRFVFLPLSYVILPPYFRIFGK